MPADRQSIPHRADLQELLGYLNFSSGTPDPKFLRNLNDLFGAIESTSAVDPLQTAGEILQTSLAELTASSAAFQDSQQAENLLHLAFVEFPAQYRAFHRDLLFHQSD